MQVIKLLKGRRITIPVEIRRKEGWKPGTVLCIEETEAGFRIFKPEVKEARVKVV